LLRVLTAERSRSTQQPSKPWLSGNEREISLAPLVRCTPEIKSRLPYPPASSSMASETRDDPPVSTTMPSALRAGFNSAVCNCDRNPTKPIPAPRNMMVESTTIVARSHPQRRRAAVGSKAASGGFWSACTFISKLERSCCSEIQILKSSKPS
jgi:hypothetical protein